MAHHQQIVGHQPPLLITRHTRSCRHASMVCAVLSFWCTENKPPAVAARALKPAGHVIVPELGAKGASDDCRAEEACADAGADAPQPAVIYRPRTYKTARSGPACATPPPRSPRHDFGSQGTGDPQ